MGTLFKSIPSKNMNDIGLYIHIPFCKRKCYYCDFISYCNKDSLIDEYIKYLNYEITDVGDGIKKALGKKYSEISTIYIGGGTPSYIDSKHIISIIDSIKNITKLDTQEITIEINPGTATRQKIEDYKNAGINRLSIGMQETNDMLLNQIGRIHSYKEFENTYKLAREVGFKNINVDIMIGLPNQTIENVERTIKKVIAFKPEHISVYSLIVEEDTPIEKMIMNKTLTLPDEETERKMYWTVKEELEKNGYKHYEISNYAIPGFESKHNSNCWNQKEYFGFGVAAHSYTDGARYSNINSIEEYIENYKQGKQENNFIFHEKQDKFSQMKEYVMLGLRKIDGVEIQKFKEKFGIELYKIFKQEIEKLEKQELILCDNEKIKLSRKGIDLANIVWQEFV